MKINSKGQVTIPRAIRQISGLHPHSEIEFEVQPNGDVLLRPIGQPVSTIRSAFARVRGSANARIFKGMSTDEYMRLVRG
jgi:antitoxin PrlF